jgi:abortive infection bacteriophage resistance protein
MPLWVIVELMSFSNISKLYNSMYYSEKDIIANAVGTGRSVLENNLHCLSVLRNKCAHAAKLYNTEYNPPASLPVNFMRQNPQVKNNSLFAYVLVLIRRLPSEEYRKDLCDEISFLLEKNKGKIDLDKMGFPSNYNHLIEKNIK